MPLTLSSTAFFDGQAIPETYVQAGKNQSPPLRWQGAPEGTKSFVLVLEDHDAPVGTVTHWVVYDIPADSDGLLEGLSKVADISSDSVGQALASEALPKHVHLKRRAGSTPDD